MAAYIRHANLGGHHLCYCRLPDITGSLLWLLRQNSEAASASSLDGGSLRDNSVKHICPSVFQPPDKAS